ncbi:MAG: PLP-dependent aminotransferase family protein [candidate division Zixibacteria bacterium]|nr:PLP-dependent aminotransferase family protein [candidate division Zixibacteria bacterium]
MGSSDEPLYLAVVRALAQDIETGVLSPEDRLPTHRELADSLGVAIGTITRAYSIGEQRGLIYGDGRRGTFVGELRRRAAALTALTDTKPAVIDLSANYPSPSEDPDLSSAMRRLARHPDVQQLLRYPSPQSPRPHREAGVRWLERLDLTVEPDDIIITAGAQHALMVIMSTIARPGDVVVTEEYTYPGLKAIGDLLGLQVVGMGCDDDGPRPDVLDEVCRKHRPCAFYTVPTLHNPTNITMPIERKRDLSAIARRYRLPVIEDEIHRALVPEAAPTFTELIPDLGIMVASVSKVIAGGLRVAFVVAPPRFRQSMLDTLHAITLVVSPIPVEILARWINDGTAAATVERRRTQARRNHALAATALDGHRFRAAPTSHFVWVPLPDPWTNAAFTAEAYRRGVAIAPSEVFAVDTAAAGSAVRICLSAADNRELLTTALETVGAILNSTPRRDSTTI